MTKLEGFIDHFEKEGAVISMADRGTACVSNRVLPEHVHEGDFIVEDDEKQQLTVNAEITELHHREIRRLCDYDFD